LKTGVFGDPAGARPAAASTSSTLPRVGSFDSSSGGAARNRAGSVRAVLADAGFGGSGDGPSRNSGSGRALVADAGFGGSGVGTGSGSGNGHGGSVHGAGFGDVAAGGGAPAAAREHAAPATTPVRILYKPKPVYTAEARAMKIQGEVLLEVVFQASGTVQVQRVVRGLGHELDAAAEQAALGIRFRPATRGGVPVDTKATVNITFELT
jgi:TonB family protein